MAVADGDKTPLDGKEASAMNRIISVVAGALLLATNPMIVAAQQDSRCESLSQQAVGKLARRLSRCHVRALRAGSRGRPFNEKACDNRAHAAFETIALEIASTCVGECGFNAIQPTEAAVRAALDTAANGLRCVPPAAPGIARVQTAALSAPAVCGGPGQETPAAPPISGSVEAADGTNLGELTLGCAYAGGGVAPPAAPATYFAGGPAVLDVQASGNPDVVQLVASHGNGPLGCTLGAGPNAHCIGAGQFGLPCTTDADCGGAGACQRDVNCFTTPPIEVDTSVANVCLVNVVREDEAGLVDVTTGTYASTLPLSTRVYLGTTPGTACPRCIASRCNAGKRQGEACTASGTSETSVDCLPNDAQFLGAIDVNLRSTTDTQVLHADAAGVFCPDQPAPGALTLPDARTIVEHGSPAGDLRDFQPHEFVTVLAGCIPASASAVITTGGGLPFPIAAATRQVIQLQH
jgi:hypothetical protein